MKYTQEEVLDKAMARFRVVPVDNGRKRNNGSAALDPTLVKLCSICKLYGEKEDFNPNNWEGYEGNHRCNECKKRNRKKTTSQDKMGERIRRQASRAI